MAQQGRGWLQARAGILSKAPREGFLHTLHRPHGSEYVLQGVHVQPCAMTAITHGGVRHAQQGGVEGATWKDNLSSGSGARLGETRSTTTRYTQPVRSTRTVGEQRGHMDQTDSTGLHNSTGQGGVGANAIPPPPPNTHTHTRNTHTQLPQRPHPHTHTLAAHAVNTSEADALQPSLPRLNPIGLLCPTRAPTSTPV